MNNLVPSYLLPYILLGSIAVVVAVVFGLHRALRLSDWSAQSRSRAFWSVSTLLVAWYFAALVPSWLGLYQGTPSSIPSIQYGLLIPIVGGVALFCRWSTLRRIVELVPQSWIVGVQAFRVLGAIFLVLYAAGRMPGVLAWPAGVNDVIVGLLAPLVGIAYSRGLRRSSVLLRAWNLFGIADLVVAVATGLLTSPSRLQMLALDKPNELINSFPLVMVPVFLVPLAVLLHLASLEKLRAAESRTLALKPVFAGARG
jgi:hypothetical protein